MLKKNIKRYFLKTFLKRKHFQKHSGNILIDCNKHIARIFSIMFSLLYHLDFHDHNLLAYKVLL